MKIVLLLFFTFLTSISSCNAGDSDPDQLSRMARIDRFVWQGAIFLKDTSLPALRELPGFKRESSVIKRNEHNPETQTEFITFEYDGLTINGFVKDSKDLGLIEVVVSKPNWKILNDLNISTPFKHVSDVLGKPTRTEGNMDEYCGETECVQFYMKSGKIEEVHFLHYTD